MSHYKRNVGSNRDALFGGASGKDKNDAPNTNNNKNKSKILGMTAASSSKSSSSSGDGSGNKMSSARIDTSRLLSNRDSGSKMMSTNKNGSSSSSKNGGGGRRGFLTGRGKLEAMKEAEDCRLKAKKCMSRGVFSGPDPVSAGMWYHKAAECYQKCGDEDRLERLHRIASGDCNRGCHAWSIAANEYSRAAELAANSDETIKRRRLECNKLYRDAAEAYLELGDLKKRGDALVKAALGLLLQDDNNNNNDNNSSATPKNKLQSMDKTALQELEEAVEAHVPDPLNPNKARRQTKVSIFLPDDDDDGAKEADNLELCKQHVVTTSYAHETLYKIVYTLLNYNEYPSALYAASAASYLLQIDPHSTISLARAYLTETVLTLAMGDVVAAEQSFLNIHLQNNYYLSSRECKLGEDLITAIRTRDAQGLHDARIVENKSAMSNLHTSVRNLTLKLQLTGLAKDKPLDIPLPKPTQHNYNYNTAPAPPAPPSTRSSYAPKPITNQPSQQEKIMEGEELQASLNANFDEMDDLMNSMGLGDDADIKNFDNKPPKTNTPQPPQQQYEEDDDDLDIDLR